MKSSNPKKPPLNSPRHNDFKLPYVQEYLRDYCNGYPNGDGFYVTDTPRKCEANALIVNIEEGRRLCEVAIQEQLQDNAAVAAHETALVAKRVDFEHLRSLAIFESTREAPCWLAGKPAGFNPVSCLATRNEIIHLPSLADGADGATVPATPNYLCTSACDFNLDPDAQTPQGWHDFLGHT